MKNNSHAWRASPLLAAACSAEHPLATSGPAADRMAVIPNVKGRWTYFSMVTHTVVGTCAVTDTLAQQAYAARTDWDIAIADGRIRTNSGTSGPGDGGIAPRPTTMNIPSRTCRPFSKPIQSGKWRTEKGIYKQLVYNELRIGKICAPKRKSICGNEKSISRD